MLSGKSTRRGWLALCLLCLNLLALSQNQQKADSLLNLLENRSLELREELEVYYWLSTYSTSPIDELSYGKQLLSLATNEGETEYIVKAQLRMGVAHRLMGNLSMALELLFEAADQANSKTELEPLLIEIYPEIATCYTQNGDHKNALNYGLKTIEILRGTDRKQDLALSLLNLGYDYYLNGEYQKALQCYDESEPILLAIGLTIGQAYIIGNRALVFWKKGNPEDAKSQLLVAIEMLKPLEDKYGMSDYHNQLAHILLEERDFEKARNHAQVSLRMAQESGLKEQIRDAFLILYRSYNEVGNHELSNQYQSQYHLYKDSIQNLQNTQQIADLRTRFEVGQKQAQVNLLLEQKRNDRIILIFTVLIILILLVSGLLIYRSSILRKRLNQQLEEQKKSLIALNDTKDKFFSIISHDLRGPATHFQGLISMIKRDHEELNKKESDELLSYLEMSAMDLSKLLENLLDWAENQEGHFPYEPEFHGLRNLLTETCALHRDMLKSKKINLELIVDESEVIFADKNSASAIFRNLLSNAIKFTPEGGNITIQSSQNGSMDYAEVQFIDNGTGITEEKLQSILDPVPGHSTEGTLGEKGLGLGLKLVQDFVELNKGDINISSTEGKGTVVAVNLPAKA